MTELYWKLYFWWHRKRCSWCKRFTEVDYHSGDGKEVPICLDGPCQDEICQHCYEQECSYDNDGNPICTECYAAQCDHVYDMMRDY